VLAKDIPAHESDFRRTGIDSNGKRHILTPLTVDIPGDDRQLTVMRCRPETGDTSFYYQQEFVKERVVLHFTAGYMKGDIATLTRPNWHVSVPFVIARDGTIYNLWSSSYWSYHLGQNAVGGNTPMSQKSVAIEISNIGPLRQEGNRLYTIYDSQYCDLNERQYYRNGNYRGYQYFATFTDEQYESLILLLRYITGRYSIPRRFLPEAIRYDVRQDVPFFYGIVSHVNFRQDKVDIGPVFDWQRVIDGVRA